VNDKDHVRFSKVALNLMPLAFGQRQPEVIRADAQLKTVSAIDLGLRLPERREKT
jgi:hypothetical protein